MTRGSASREGSASRKGGLHLGGLHPGGLHLGWKGLEHTPHGILWDTVNERAVCILLECIRVILHFIISRLIFLIAKFLIELFEINPNTNSPISFFL